MYNQLNSQDSQIFILNLEEYQKVTNINTIYETRYFEYNSDD